jgi:protein-tyrosine phosphatase
VIDLHSHVLPGLDDGAAEIDEALAICRAAAADGVEAMAGTPHVRSDYPTTAAAMRSAVTALQAAAGDLIRLLPGAELALEELTRPIDELTAFGLAGNPGYLLVETPYFGWPLDIGQTLARLQLANITPVLAHPERNGDVQKRPDLLEPLVARGVLIQVTASAVDGSMGRQARNCVRKLLERGWAHLIASDAHAPVIRAAGMSAAASAVGNPALARWLTVDVPRAIVENAALPARP